MSLPAYPPTRLPAYPPTRLQLVAFVFESLIHPFLGCVAYLYISALSLSTLEKYPHVNVALMDGRTLPWITLGRSPAAAASLVARRVMPRNLRLRKRDARIFLLKQTNQLFKWT